MAVPAFTRKVPALCFVSRIERNAKRCQSLNGLGCIFDDEFNRLSVVKTTACYHRIADMIFKRIAGFKHGGNPTLCPCRRAVA